MSLVDCCQDKQQEVEENTAYNFILQFCNSSTTVILLIILTYFNLLFTNLCECTLKVRRPKSDGPGSVKFVE